MHVAYFSLAFRLLHNFLFVNNWLFIISRNIFRRFCWWWGFFFRWGQNWYMACTVH